MLNIVSFEGASDDPNDKELCTRFLLARRQKMTIQGEDCDMLSFSDFTKYKQFDEMKLENEVLNMLTATVTHELKTPLNCVVSFATMALKQG